MPSGEHDELFLQIGLDELVEKNYSKVAPLIAGLPVGEGLSKEAAEDLGLIEGTPVGSAIIDAYGGFHFYVYQQVINSHFFFKIIGMQGGLGAWLLGTKRMENFRMSFLLLKMEVIDWQSLLAQVLAI